jgi:hypothetical protein
VFSATRCELRVEIRCAMLAVAALTVNATCRKFDLLISSVVTVAHEKVYEVTYADH